MTDLNSVTLGGRITKDATIEKTKDGISMVRISMAVNRSKKKKDSEEYEDKPIFVDLAPVFGNYADAMVKHLTKGTYITVEGYLDMDSWISDDGHKNQRLKVVPKIGCINPWVERKLKPQAGQPDKAEQEAMSAAENSENYIC